jgi:hypothetical protein
LSRSEGWKCLAEKSQWGPAVPDANGMQKVWASVVVGKPTTYFHASLKKRGVILYNQRCGHDCPLRPAVAEASDQEWQHLKYFSKINYASSLDTYVTT